MFSRKALGAMAILVGCCLLGNPSEASVGGVVRGAKEFIYKVFKPLFKPPEPYGKYPQRGDFLKEDSNKLMELLEESGKASLKTTLRERADAVWSNKIFPAVEEKWKFDPNKLSKVQRKTLQDICTRAYIRSIKKEDFTKEIIGLGLEKTDNKLLGEALFLVELANPELTRKDALCLLRTKVTEEMLEQAASIWRKFAPLSTCLKTIMNKAPLVNDCQ